MSQHNDAENSVNGPAETEKVNNQVNTEESVGENTETNTEESTENRPNEEIYLSKDYALRDPVQRDERQVSDECDDYVFKIPKKHRTHTSSSSGSHHHHHHHGHHHHHHHKEDENLEEGFNRCIVYINRFGCCLYRNSCIFDI